MGCLITSGRKVPCKSAVGGIKTIYFADYGTLGTATIVAGEITAVSGTPTWFQFDVKGNSSMETAITSSRENGTTFFTYILVFINAIIFIITLVNSLVCAKNLIFINYVVCITNF